MIPPKYHEALWSELHNMHSGIAKMKLLSTAYAWWPKLDEAIESTVKSCSSCQIVSKKPALTPLKPLEWPYILWSRVHIDFTGPLEGKMVLVSTLLASLLMHMSCQVLHQMQTWINYGIHLHCMDFHDA